MISFLFAYKDFYAYICIHIASIESALQQPRRAIS